jgi:EF hand
MSSMRIPLIASGVIAAGALAIGGAVVYNLTRGAKIEPLADELLRSHDHDRDGSIAYRQAKDGHEHLRVEKDLLWDEGDIGDQFEIINERRKFEKMDANGDGQVTRPEMLATLRAYDSNGNGRITVKEEWPFEKVAPSSRELSTDHEWDLPDWARDLV